MSFQWHELESMRTPLDWAFQVACSFLFLSVAAMIGVGAADRVDAAVPTAAGLGSLAGNDAVAVGQLVVTWAVSTP